MLLIPMDQSYTKLLEDVSYMRGKMDSTFSNIEKTSEKVSVLLESHDKRLGSVERNQDGITTRVGLAGGGIGTILTLVVNYLFHKLP